MRRHRYAVALGVILALGAAMPVTAAGERAVRFADSESWTVEHACGVTEQTTVDFRGTAFFDAGGHWLRDILVYSVRAEFSGPGGSLATTAHQVGEFTPTTGTFLGQGIFIHGGKIGVLVWDVGRLVFDPSDGSTLSATPKVVRFDDPAAGAAIDAALCEALG